MVKVHLSEIISSVELYCFNIGGGLCSEWGKVHLSEIISSVELCCFNIGGYFQTRHVMHNKVRYCI